MALIECNECGKEISDQAKSCPHCGAAPNKKPTNWIAVSVIFVAVFVILFSMSGNNSDSKAISYAMSEVRKQLKDPDSAEFKDITVNSNGIPCGYVNSRNAFGGFTGFKRFVGTGSMIAIEGESNTQNVDFDEIWRVVCSS